MQTGNLLSVRIHYCVSVLSHLFLNAVYIIFIKRFIYISSHARVRLWYCYWLADSVSLSVKCTNNTICTNNTTLLLDLDPYSATDASLRDNRATANLIISIGLI
jgi:hypothetical protein